MIVHVHTWIAHKYSWKWNSMEYISCCKQHSKKSPYSPYLRGQVLNITPFTKLYLLYSKSSFLSQFLLPSTRVHTAVISHFYLVVPALWYSRLLQYENTERMWTSVWNTNMIIYSWMQLHLHSTLLKNRKTNLLHDNLLYFIYSVIIWKKTIETNTFHISLKLAL